MDPDAFHKTFHDILEHNEKEGPTKNIFEPKFEARETAEKLEVTLKNALKDLLPVGGGADADADADAAASELLEKNRAAIIRAQWQLSRLLVFLANNAHELEDEADAEHTLLRAARISILTSQSKLLFASQAAFKPELVDPIPLPELLKMSAAEMVHSERHGVFFHGVQWLLDCLNSLGVFLSSRMEADQRIGDAICVLHKVEEIFARFNAWAKESDGDNTSLHALPWKDDKQSQELDLSKAASEKEREQLTRRLFMEQRYTSTLFYLAQGYGLRGDQVRASKYAYLTMVHQLLCRKDFSRKDWATNAVHLSSFFIAEGEFGYARHCLEASRHLMPTEDPTEETVGTTAWGFVKFYKALMKHYAARKEEIDEIRKKYGDEAAAAAHIEAGPTHAGSVTGVANWWVDMPLPIPKPAPVAAITTFDEARAVFKSAQEEILFAQKYYVYDGCCPEFIKLQEDLAELYKYLAAFEPALDRRIAFHMRRVELLEKFPKDLNFESYTRQVRQSLFDLGDLLSDIIDLRHEQRKFYFVEAQAAVAQGKKRPPRPHGSSDAALTALVAKAQQMYRDFMETYRDKITKKMPGKIDKDSQPAFVRAKIRIARLEGKVPCTEAQQEYEMIKRMKDLYGEVVAFAEHNDVVKNDPSLETEVTLARDMQPLLEGKMRDVQRVYAKQRA